jgi:hypothetical protein
MHYVSQSNASAGARERRPLTSRGGEKFPMTEKISASFQGCASRVSFGGVSESTRLTLQGFHRTNAKGASNGQIRGGPRNPAQQSRCKQQPSIISEGCEPGFRELEPTVELVATDRCN